ncbi:MAG: endolytic transglycosylase MltG [Deltaproteobacteria bacterium]|nr:endolytic transglycosylase MltG [Deltaproteobacteria bacterium]
MSNHSSKKTIIAVAILFFLVLVSLILGFGLFFLSPYERNAPEQFITVREGLGLRAVAIELEERNIISSKSLFMIWGKIMGYSRKIKAGEYRLGSDMAPMRILEILTRGEIITHPVTIPEGYSNKQIAEILEQKGMADKRQFLALASNRDLILKYGFRSSSLEGFLYPDTYQFGKGLSAESIIDAMVNRFKTVVAPFEHRLRELEMTVEEVVTLASIVEKETGRADERALIAGVFLNRLKKNMRLESDPTVIYGIENFNGNLTRKDLEVPTPYNTYIIRGLPPGPIANPGIEAIKAVLYPAEIDYFYFVSKNDGSHYFSSSLREHINAVNRYQRSRRKESDRTS